MRVLRGSGVGAVLAGPSTLLSFLEAGAASHFPSKRDLLVGVGYGQETKPVQCKSHGQCQVLGEGPWGCGNTVGWGLKARVRVQLCHCQQDFGRVL